MEELLTLRQENSKTYDVGSGKRQLVVSIGAIHYKDNYADKSEQWKDIDLTWEGNRITKAPYELTLDGKKITVKDKKSGEVSTIELLSIFPPGVMFEIVPEYTRVSFRHILLSDKIPFEAKFKITGKGLITTKAFDDEGELELETERVDGVLTEKLSKVIDKETHKERPAKGNIRIDPTWQVGASSDDASRRLNPDYWSLIWPGIIAGHQDPGAGYLYGGGMRFTNITIPQGATVSTAYLTLRANFSMSTTVVNTRISAEDVDDAPTFADNAAAYDARWAARTTARVDWDSIPAWTVDNDYNSPSIVTVIQEIVSRALWASGNNIVIFWEDYEERSTQSADVYRQAYSYDGSTTYAPKLVVTYTVLVGLENKSANMGSKMVGAGLI